MPKHMEFAIPEHQARFERLAKLKFGQTHFPYLNTIREIQLSNDMAGEVEQLLAVGSWHQLLLIHEPAIHMLTVEVLHHSSLIDHTQVLIG